jgi:hypothetical protein
MPAPMVAEFLAFVTFSSKAVDLLRLTHLAARAAVAWAMTFVVHDELRRSGGALLNR